MEGHIAKSVRLRFLFRLASRRPDIRAKSDELDVNMFPSKESVEGEDILVFNVLPKFKKEVENS